MNEKTEGSVEFDPFAGPELALTAPSTEPQREIWTAVQMGDDASCAFNESVTLTLRGSLDVTAFGAAWNDLVARHESLRTTFSPDGLTLCVAASQLVDVPLLDFSASDAHGREAAWKAVLAREVETAFNLERGPLLRVNLVRMTDSEHRVTVTAHHIVCDGWSMAVMLRDLGELYSARRGSPAATLKPAFAFSDYARAQEEQARTEEFAADEAYWLKRFAGSIPVLDLPVDRTRPPAKTYTSRREDYVLEASLVEAVKKVGLRAGCSFFTTLLAGFEVLLYRLSGQDDLVVGIPAAGQSVAGQDSLVGHCVNMLPLRSALDGAQPFTEFLKRVRTTMLDAYDHQKFTFGTLLKKLPLPRDPSRLPLVSVLFNVDQAINGTTLNYAGLEVEFHSTPRHFENFDIFINAAETNGRVVVETQYNSDLFDAETIHRWLSTFEVLLRSIAADASGALERLPILPEADRAKVLGWNDTTAMPYPRDLCTHELFEAQAREKPDATAILFGERRVTYGELDARANRAAHVLRDAGAGRGSLVGLAMERSVDLIVGLLAILKTGSAYVPLDPAYPKDRIEHMITDSKMPVILTQAALAAALPAHGAKVVTLEETTSGDAAPLRRDADSTKSATPEDSAYVIYTSGSTGKPKGVLVPHRAVVNFLTTMREAPGMTSRDVILAVTTLSFDIAVLELHLPLSLGATIVLASREVAGDGALLLAAIEKHGVTVMQATPSTWRLLLAAGWKGGDTFKAICGGEALPRDLAGELVRRAGNVWNMYGPTETTVWSTCYRLPKPAGRILIGKPIGNTQVYILDTHLQPVPIGVPGELHIGGDGVTHGYLHRAELTAERFIADPFRGGNKIYKTGDLARFLPDGNIEYLRRNDNQVKVRGFRIELGEIEVALATHPGVKQAVVVVREDRPGDVRLVGYVVPAGKGADTSDAALRAHLRTGLPEYMVPQHFVELDAVPLTPNGKVDRRALPAPQLGAGDGAEAYVAPRTDAEKLLAEIWQDILGISRVSVNDNFFNLGGHSLLAAQVMTRLSRDHGVALPMRRLFEAPTIAALAALLDARSGGADTAAGGAAPLEPTRIPRRTETGPSPVSLMQQRVWYLEQFTPESLIFNLPSAFRIKGKLDVAAFQRALDEIVTRHEPLRTSLALEGDAPVQIVAPSLRLDVTAFTDLSDRSITAREAELMKLLHARANEALRADTFPLVVARLFKLSDDEWVFFYMPHHAVFDGWSFDTFLRELDVLYGAFAQNKPSPLEDLPITYSDFATWHRDWLKGEELERQSAYWRKQLAGELPLLEMPTDKPRPPTMSLRGATEPFNLSKAEVETLTALGRQCGATLYMVLLAAFEATLARWTGQEDVLVGTPIRGRSWPETENLIGFFVNTLVFRTDLSGSPSFIDLIGRVRTTVLDAFSHQDMPFELLVQQLNVRRDMSRTPIFQAFFTFQDVKNRNSAFGNLPYGQIHVHAAASPTDINLWVKETGEGVVGGLDYATDLFEQGTIVRFLKNLRTLLASVVLAPQSDIKNLAILPDTERRQLTAWNDATAMDFPREARVHDLFERQAAAKATDVALVFGDDTVTYGELDQRANRVARRLWDAGAGRGTVVGLAMDRSIEMVVGLLGIMKSGSAYVPLDPAYPKDRIEFMVADSKMPVILTQAALAPSVPAHGAKVVTIEETSAGDGSALPRDTARSATPEDPAYVIYTSGSTGKPKGVLVPHRAVVNFLTTMRDQPGLTAQDVLLAVTTLSFDIAVLELHLPLSVGAKIILASREVAGDGALLRDAIARHAVTTMQATPSTWRLLLGAGWTGDESFKAICGGEALPQDLASDLVKRAGSVWNMYGPTETTVWSTCYRLPKSGGRILIGKPIGNTQVYILDAQMQPVPIGVPGELHIGGDGVTLGYLHRPELTAERFPADPNRPGTSAKIYKTGDLARFLPDGNIEYLRRNDNQVKVRGYRIELGEIEAALATHEAVAHPVVIVREDRPGDVRLVAYLVAKPGADASDGALRAHLRATLPEYMVPQHFVQLEKIPLTPNGKVDRRALPAPELQAGSGGDAYVEPRSDAEKLLAGIWKDILGVPRVGVNDNFFDLGGHSLLAGRVMTRLSRDHGVVVPMRRIFETPTIAALAADLGANAQGAPTRIPRRSESGPAPLSLMQQRIWYLEQLSPESRVYNLPATFRIRGKVDVSALQRALDEIIARHEPLRTVLSWQNDAPAQVVMPTLKIALSPAVDLSDRPTGEREASLAALLATEVNMAIRVSEGPLTRAKLFKLADDDWVFFFVTHHAAFDGASYDILADEIDRLYGAFVAGKPSPLPELPIAYSDFATWHRAWLQGEELDRQSAYWKEKLAGELPDLKMPTDRARPSEMSARGATEPFELSKAEADALTALGRRHGATLYMVLLAAFKATLARWTGQTDILIGTPVRGRSWPETEHLIGFFANTLVFRTDLSGSPTFTEVVKRVRATTLDAFSHEDMPFELLVQALNVPRDNSRTPVFQAFFTFQDMSELAPTLGGMPYEHLPVAPDATPADLSFWLNETGNGIMAGLIYATDLFDRSTIARFLDTYRTFLASVVEEPNVDIARVKLLPESQKRLIDGWNETAKRAVPPNTCYHHLFEERAAATPDAPAVTFGDATISYGELNRRANRLARKLRAMGAKTDVLVGIWLERSIDMVVAFMATLKAGATYVPVDPNYPPDRVHYIIGDSKMAIFISESALAPHLPSHEAQVVLLDTHASAIDGESDENLPRSGDPDAATPASRVYVIYTSGSTGKPKGVEVTHGNVVNYVRSALREPGTAPDDVMLAVVSLAFDVHVSEYHVPLAAGARVVIAPGDAVADGERLVELIEKYGITFMSCTPATYRLIVNAGWKGARRFKLTSAGDTFPRHTVNDLRALGVDVWNSYGPTETTVVCTMYHVTADEPTPSIGHAMDNTTLHILDAHMQHVPIGVPGELWIGGEVVARGYLNRPDLTKERFIPDPFSAEPGARLYRSGDVVRFRPDGNLDFVGRNDNQVKLRGYRIELGEIENALARIDGVKEAAVVIREDRPGDRKLVGYTVPRPGADYTESELRKALRKTLPDYMVPQAFVELDAFPLSANKKVDRKALPAPQGAVGAPDDDHVEPRTDAERLVAAVWRDVLGIAHVSVHDNFFNIGGHSLSSIQVIGQVEKQTGKRLTPRNLLFGTLEQVANELGPVGASATGTEAVAAPSTSPSMSPAGSPSAAPTSPSTPPRPSTSPSAPPGAGAVPLAKRMFDKLKSTIQRK